MDPEADNFYAAPQAEVQDPGYAGSEAEAIRREHVTHEASIKSVGALFLLGGVLSCLWGLVSFGVSVNGALGDGRPQEPFFLIFGPIVSAVGAIQFAVGYGLRKLAPGSKIPATVLAALSILSFPCGTALGIYTIYLLFSAKGAVVFSEDYKDVIAATPHVKARTSAAAWVVLILLLALIGFGILAASLG